MSRQFKDWLVEYKQTNYDGYSNLMQKVVEKKSMLENEGVIS